MIPKLTCSGVKFSNLFQQEQLTSLICPGPRCEPAMLLQRCPDGMFPNPLGNELFSLMGTSLSLGLFSIYLNYGGRKDKNAKAKKSFFLPPKCWNSLSLPFPSAFLLITVNNGFWCCFYWLSIWGHKNVNVSPRNNTFGELARLFLLFKIFLLQKEERICWTKLSHDPKQKLESRDHHSLG